MEAETKRFIDNRIEKILATSDNLLNRTERELKKIVLEQREYFQYNVRIVVDKVSSYACAGSRFDVSNSIEDLVNHYITNNTISNEQKDKVLDIQKNYGVRKALDYLDRELLKVG